MCGLQLLSDRVRSTKAVRLGTKERLTSEALSALALSSAERSRMRFKACVPALENRPPPVESSCSVSFELTSREESILDDVQMAGLVDSVLQSTEQRQRLPLVAAVTRRNWTRSNVQWMEE